MIAIDVAFVLLILFLVFVVGSLLGPLLFGYKKSDQLRREEDLVRHQKLLKDEKFRLWREEGTNHTWDFDSEEFNEYAEISLKDRTRENDIRRR